MAAAKNEGWRGGGSVMVVVEVEEGGNEADPRGSSYCEKRLRGGVLVHRAERAWLLRPRLEGG